MEQNNIPYDLITKYLAGECHSEEKSKLESWKAESVENAELFEQMNISWAASTPPVYQADVESALDKVSDKLEARPTKAFPVRTLTIAMAAVLVIAVGVFTILKDTSSSDSVVLVSLNDSKPTEYVLADGSKITMKKGAMITYAGKFTKNERRIAFKGEAYFDIEPDKNRPFIIETGDTETRVLGTEFNLIAIADTMVQVIVTEGKVSLSLTDVESEEIFIEPGQVGEYYSDNKQLEKRQNQDPNFLSWKSGKLVFDNQDLESALQQLSKHYEIDLAVDDTALLEQEITAVFDNYTIEEALQNLELILGLTASVDGDKYRLN